MKLVSRQLDLVATSFLFVFDVATTRCCHDLLFCAIDVATARCCRDFLSVKLLSRHPGVVATSFLWNCCHDNQVLSRPQVFAIDVATARCCRDFLSVELLSRQPGVVTTSSLHYCCRDLSLELMMSRPLFPYTLMSRLLFFQC